MLAYKIIASITLRSIVQENDDRLQTLLNKGVIIPDPRRVTIGHEVNLDLIAPGVTLKPGTNLQGELTSIGPGCVVSSEITNCNLGKGVKLSGGEYINAVILDGVTIQHGALVRAGTLIEEGCELGQSVGLKQSILMAYSMIGSVVNACDFLMSGGDIASGGLANFSEIGSGVIFANFTPRGSKDTPTMLGDVSHGVLYNNQKIFIGANSVLVGPVTIAYGVIVPAMTEVRGNILTPNTVVSSSNVDQAVPLSKFDVNNYKRIRRVVENNLAYIGNILALITWYENARQSFMSADKYSKACYDGAIRNLNSVLNERIKWMDELYKKIPISIDELQIRRESGEYVPEIFLKEQKAFVENWTAIKGKIELVYNQRNERQVPKAINSIQQNDLDKGFIPFILGLDYAQKEEITDYLKWFTEQFPIDWE